MLAYSNVSTSKKRKPSSEARPQPSRRERAREAEKQPPNPLLNEARKVLARKRFGQNFLIHQGMIDGIVRCMDLAPDDVLLEIGPGLGFLTQALLPKVTHLTAVELDRFMVGYLEKKFAPQLAEQQLTLVQQDILAFDLARLGDTPFKVVGNLPYNITSGVLFKFAGELTDTEAPWRNKVRQLTFMVQREVGERITATPGGKSWGPLSIALQYWFDCYLELTVPPQCFQPAPKVTSVVVSLYPKQTPYPEVDLHLMNTLVRASFQQRRKTLRNSLLHGTGLQEPALLQALEQAGIPPSQRPEQLSIDDFIRLTHAVKANLAHA